MEQRIGEILSTVRRLESTVDRLDYALHGNGVEGLSSKFARLDMSHGEHAKRLDGHDERMMAVERRLFWWMGAAAALGGLVGVLAPTLVTKWL